VADGYRDDTAQSPHHNHRIERVGASQAQDVLRLFKVSARRLLQLWPVLVNLGLLFSW
jgi:hypothetical protein